MEWITLAAVAVLPLAAMQCVELGVGIYNARRVTKIQHQANRAEQKLDSLIEALNKGAEEIERSGMRGGVDPRELVESREAKADQAARTEMEILSQAVEYFGERWGPAIIEWVRINAPGPWKRALKNPAMARTILTPAFALAQKMIQANSKGAHGGNGTSGGFSPAGFE